MSTKVDKVKTIELAEKHIRAGKIREAIAEYEKVVALDDQDLGTLNMIGDLYLRLRQEDQAVRAFERVASGYEKRGQYSQALAIYKKICKINPDDPEFGMKLADLFSIQGYATDARAQYLKAAEHWEKARRPGDAVRVYEKLVRLEREDFVAKQKLAELYHKVGNSDGAIEQLNELAELRMARGQMDEAETVLQEALRLNPLYNRTIINLVDIYRKQEKPVRAIALIEVGVHAGLADPYLLNLLGNLYFEGRQYPKAEELFERVLADHPMSVNARIKLGRLFVRRNKLDEAFALFEPLVNNLLKKQKEEKAVGLLGLILVSQRTHLPTLEKLAGIYRAGHDLEKLEVVDRVIFEELRKAGQKERAQEILEEVLTLKPDDEDMKWERDQLFAPEPKPEPPAPKLEPRPQPQPEPKPAVRPVPKPEPKVELKPEPPPKPAPEVRPEPKVQVKPEPPPKLVLEVQPEPQEEEKPRTRPESPAEPWFEVAATPAPPPPVKAPPEPPSKPAPPPAPPLESRVEAKPAPPPAAPSPPERRPTPIEEFKPVLPTRPRPPTASRPEPIPEPPPEVPVVVPPPDIFAERLDVTRTEINDVFRQAELYIQQGLVRNARRILETLRQEYPDHEEIERKIQELDQPRPSLDEEEIRRRVEKAAEMESQLRDKLVQLDEDHRQKIPEYMPRGKAKEKFAEAGLLSEIETGPFGKPEEAAKAYYDLRDRLEEEARMMETVYAQQARGATTQFEKELTNIVEDWRRDFKTKFQQDDYEIHFQLGVAFMEQGLYNEAIEELTIAAKDEARTLECYCIISYCHRQRKSYVDAVKWLKRALLLAPSGSDSYYALEYELGLLYEELRDRENALPLFRDVRKWNADYRDVAQRIGALEKPSPESSA